MCKKDPLQLQTTGLFLSFKLFCVSFCSFCVSLWSFVVSLWLFLHLFVNVLLRFVVVLLPWYLDTGKHQFDYFIPENIRVLNETDNFTPTEDVSLFNLKLPAKENCDGNQN